MRLVFARFDDGHESYLFRVGPEFDLQAWIKSREKVFRLLCVAGLIVEEVD